MQVNLLFSGCEVSRFGVGEDFCFSVAVVRSGLRIGAIGCRSSEACFDSVFRV